MEQEQAKQAADAKARAKKKVKAKPISDKIDIATPAVINKLAALEDDYGKAKLVVVVPSSVEQLYGKVTDETVHHAE